MPMNRVQFQKGMSLSEFVERCGTEEACERELEAQRWPSGFVCPNCGSGQYSNFRRGRLLYYQCCECRHQASLIAGTVMASSKLGLRRWFQAAYVLSQAKNNVSALELMRHLGVCYQTAWSLKHKLMEAMWTRERTRTLRGTVQLDEAFLGGQATGRGSWGRKGKVPLLAAVSAAPDGKAAQVCLSPQPATGEDVVVFCLNTLEPWQHGGLRWGAQLQLRELEPSGATPSHRDRRRQASLRDPAAHCRGVRPNVRANPDRGGRCCKPGARR